MNDAFWNAFEDELDKIAGTAESKISSTLDMLRNPRRTVRGAIQALDPPKQTVREIGTKPYMAQLQSEKHRARRPGKGGLRMSPSLEPPPL